MKIGFGSDSIALGTNEDEGVYVRGTVTDKSGNTRERVLFDLQIIEGDIGLHKTAGGRYYADKPGTAKAIVTYVSENTFSYNLYEGDSGEKTIRYRLCAPQVVENTVSGRGPAANSGTNPAENTGAGISQGDRIPADGGDGGKRGMTPGLTALCAAAPVAAAAAAVTAVVLKKRSGHKE